MAKSAEVPSSFYGFSGLLKSGPGGVSPDHPVTEVAVAVIAGALFGMISGFVLSKAMRFFTMVRGKRIGHYTWIVLACTLVGGLTLGILQVVK